MLDTILSFFDHTGEMLQTFLNGALVRDLKKYRARQRYEEQQRYEYERRSRSRYAGSRYQNNRYQAGRYPSGRAAQKQTAPKPLRISRMNHLILYFCVLVYSEIVLRLLTHTGLFQNLIYPILFAIAYGAFLNVVTTPFPPKVNRRIMLAVLIITGFLYTMECLIHSSYQTYMTLSSIMTGAGGVLTGYLSEFIMSIIGGIIPIILFMLPAVCYKLFGKRFSPAFRFRPYFSGLMFGIGLLVLGISAFIAGHGGSAASYTSTYNFDTAAVIFGLPTSLRLSLTRSEMEDSGFAAVQTVASTEGDEEAIPFHIDEYIPEVEDVVEKVKKTYNMLDIDLQSIAASGNSEVASLCEYVESQTASKTNDYTGLFEGKNLIMICAEAFSDKAIRKELTPTLYRLRHNGIYFSDYYQPTWGGSTITGELSFLTGLVPTNGVDTIYETIGDNQYFTMGNQLQRLGYYTAGFHNGDYNYYERDTTHENFGFGSWLGTGNGLELLTGGRYPSDGKMLTSTLETYAGQQPFCTYYMTVDGHAKYVSSSKYVKNNMDYVTSHLSRDYENTTLYYLCYQYQLELALTDLVEMLENYNLADNTVICLTADHYPYGLSKSSSWGNSKDYVQDLYGGDDSTPWDRDHNALIIWSGCLENDLKDYAVEISEPTYSLDILPTLSNLFGLEYDSRFLVGRDVFSDQEAIVLWANGSWLTSEGSYNAKGGKYTNAEGHSMDEDYKKRISDTVSNKIKYSKKVRSTDFWGAVFGEDTDTSDNAKNEGGAMNAVKELKGN